jgi:hypothetical protein
VVVGRIVIVVVGVPDTVVVLSGTIDTVGKMDVRRGREMLMIGKPASTLLVG